MAWTIGNPHVLQRARSCHTVLVSSAPSQPRSNKSFGLSCHVLSGHNIWCGVHILLVSLRRNAMKQDSGFQFSAVWPPTKEKVCPMACELRPKRAMGSCSASVKEGMPTSTTACLTLMRAAEAKAHRPTWIVCPNLAHVVKRHEEPQRKMVASKATFQATENSVLRAPVRCESALSRPARGD